MEWATDPDARQRELLLKMAEQATAQYPQREGAWLAHSRALREAGRIKDARVCLCEAVGRLPASAPLHAALARIMTRDNALDEAVQEAQRAAVLAPHDARWQELYAELRELAGGISNPQRQLRLCEKRLADNPCHTNARYLRALTLARLGRSEDACDAMPLGRLVHIADLPLPPGFSEPHAFRRQLADEVLRNPTLVSDPRRKATREGRQTQVLRQPDAPAVEALLEQIRQAVNDYERLPNSSRDSFVLSRPRRARLHAWAVIHGREGSQLSHYHASGWLSGVYYVAAPRRPGGNAYRGPLQLGCLGADAHGFEPPWEVIEVEPVPGRLVLFPSFVPHATEATNAEGVRISIAFDVVPIDKPAPLQDYGRDC